MNGDQQNKLFQIGGFDLPEYIPHINFITIFHHLRSSPHPTYNIIEINTIIIIYVSSTVTINPFSNIRTMRMIFPVRNSEELPTVICSQLKQIVLFITNIRATISDRFLGFDGAGIT
ncbi:hypothetical protein BDA99DRAFT_533795 [Phascolomyces articulosus]|uniref:Uncharacterized protein n=1 Tax=Phascolomyces articulosus TaxID=60185 RepID=A0AAD5K7P2_9FUNG|nr:hypothetical protein BDA99DRAFT_533795 [Phascolomyces articulosus]